MEELIKTSLTSMQVFKIHFIFYFFLNYFHYGSHRSIQQLNIYLLSPLALGLDLFEGDIKLDGVSSNVKYKTRNV